MSTSDPAIGEKPRETERLIIRLGRAGTTLRLPMSPGLGIAGAVMGTLMALTLIPRFPQEVGALRWSALAMTAGLLLAPMVCFFKNPRSIFRIEYILTLAPIYWLLLDLIQASYPLQSASDGAIRGAFLGIGLFVVAAWLGVQFKALPMPRFVRRAASRELAPRVVFLLIVALFVLAMMKFAIPSEFDVSLMIRALGRSRWATPWARGQLGGVGAFLDHVVYFGYVVPCLVVLLASKIGWFKVRVYIGIALSIVLALFMAQEGGRRIIGVVFGSAMVYWILIKPNVTVGSFLKFAAMAAALLFLLQVMLAYRQHGFSAVLEESRQIELDDKIRVDDNFLRLCQIIDIFPDRVPYVYHQQILFTLVRPIPRVLWPGKPIDPGYDLPSLVGEFGLSLTSSCLGEFFASLGFFGILIGGFVYGSIARFFSPLLMEFSNPERLLIYAFASLVVFAGVRSTIELVLMSYGLLAWLFSLVIFVRGRG